ncbi:hypothetical protein [Flavobacterium sp.]|jgi:hypothetical protein|uniref:hypothetical protein n=1 Tax=Flavobacterium sp. TaxID=239 RepID=UPI0037BFAECB
MDIKELGTLYENELALPGWHVDSLQPIEGADSYLVTPASPSHGFAGVPDLEVYRYRFDSQEQFRALVPVEVEHG